MTILSNIRRFLNKNKLTIENLIEEKDSSNSPVLSREEIKYNEETLYQQTNEHFKNHRDLLEIRIFNNYTDFTKDISQTSLVKLIGLDLRQDLRLIRSSYEDTLNYRSPLNQHEPSHIANEIETLVKTPLYLSNVDFNHNKDQALVTLDNGFIPYNEKSVPLAIIKPYTEIGYNKLPVPHVYKTVVDIVIMNKESKQGNDLANLEKKYHKFQHDIFAIKVDQEKLLFNTLAEARNYSSNENNKKLIDFIQDKTKLISLGHNGTVENFKQDVLLNFIIEPDNKKALVNTFNLLYNNIKINKLENNNQLVIDISNSDKVHKQINSLGNQILSYSNKTKEHLKDISNQSTR